MMTPREEMQYLADRMASLSKQPAGMPVRFRADLERVSIVLGVLAGLRTLPSEEDLRLALERREIRPLPITADDNTPMPRDETI